MRILIGQSASELRRAAVMRVLDMRRDVAAFACANVCERRVDRHAGTVGLGRGRHDDRRLCERNACLGQTELKGAVNARFDDRRALRISEADVLARDDQHTPRRRDHVSSLEQTREIMHRCIRVRASNGFLQRGQNVIMAVAVAVVAHVRTLRRLPRIRERDAVLPCSGDKQLDRAERLAHISADRLRDM